MIETITLESGNLLNLNSFWEYGEDGEYILRYFDSFGDTILNIHNFLDHHQFYINDLERKGDELIFSGLYYGLVDDVGFVLITDTLGEFNELVIQGTVTLANITVLQIHQVNITIHFIQQESTTNH
ncbi:MAG: hypothetical protein IPH42_01395 [Bacteroidetes bacterium]|nr:hypothetical protein [Bacteroidota bacterium]